MDFTSGICAAASVGRNEVRLCNLLNAVSEYGLKIPCYTDSRFEGKEKSNEGRKAWSGTTLKQKRQVGGLGSVTAG